MLNVRAGNSSFGLACSFDIIAGHFVIVKCFASKTCSWKLPYMRNWFHICHWIAHVQRKQTCSTPINEQIENWRGVSSEMEVFYSKSSKVHPFPIYCNTPRANDSSGDGALPTAFFISNAQIPSFLSLYESCMKKMHRCILIFFAIFFWI